MHNIEKRENHHEKNIFFYKITHLIEEGEDLKRE